MKVITSFWIFKHNYDFFKRSLLIFGRDVLIKFNSNGPKWSFVGFFLTGYLFCWVIFGRDVLVKFNSDDPKWRSWQAILKALAWMFEVRILCQSCVFVNYYCTTSFLTPSLTCQNLKYSNNYHINLKGIQKNTVDIIAKSLYILYHS